MFIVSHGPLYSTAIIIFLNRCFARNKVLTMIDKNGLLCFNKTALVEAGYDEDSPPSCFYQVSPHVWILNLVWNIFQKL